MQVVHKTVFLFTVTVKALLYFHQSYIFLKDTLPRYAARKYFQKHVHFIVSTFK